MRIRTRLWASLAFLLCVSAGIGFFIASSMRDMRAGIVRSQIYDEVLLEAFALNTLVSNLHLQPGKSVNRQLREVFNTLGTLLDKLSTAGAEDEFMIRQIRKNEDDLGLLLGQILGNQDAVQDPAEAERRRLLESQIRIKVRFITDDTQRLLLSNRERILTEQDHLNGLVLALVTVLILTSGAIFALANRRIAGGISRLSRGAENIAGGNLRYRIEMDGRDEIADLAGAFNKMAESLQASYHNLRLHARKLEQSNRELEQFAFIASHDLQEPLRKIQSFGDLLLMDAGDGLGPKERDHLLRMQKASARMRDLIEALLEYSRVLKMREPFVPVDLNVIMDEVLADLEASIEETRGRIKVFRLPTIQADPVQMRQLLQNLISNALKYHREDAPPEIRVASACNGSGDKMICRIEVADNGIGFEDEYLDKIFTPFQRLHSRQEFEGTGIGLAICRMIVERHGGEITAKGTPGKGATFIVSLPAHHAASAGNEP